MYKGVKQATGKPTKKIAPLTYKTGNFITDRDKQMKGWVGHYLNLYSRENFVTLEARDKTKNLPKMEEFDPESTLAKFSKAIDALACDRAPEYIIPRDNINYWKPALLEPLHGLQCLCWREGKVPLDMRDTKITTLYKIRVSTEAEITTGISLCLSIVRKVFARVVLVCLQVFAEHIHPKS